MKVGIDCCLTLLLAVGPSCLSSAVLLVRLQYHSWTL